jgi:CRP-like cAMP-binding protein
VRLHKNAKVDLLRRVPLFAALGKRDLERLGGIADELDLGATRTLIKEGTRGREFFVLVEGEAKVTKNDRRVATMRAGDFFGEIALITDVPRTTTVTADTPVRLLVLTKRDFQRLLREQPQIQRRVLEALAKRLAPETI